MEKRIPISEVPAHAGKTVVVSGWVQTRRDHGKLIFIDLRDRSGLLQVVFTPHSENVRKLADQLRPEWVVSITGMVNQRPKGMENPVIATGSVELSAHDLIILAKAHTPPFAIDTDGKDVNEELRLKYRYLDLRRQRMARNIIMRHEIVLFMRNWLSKQGFIEIETPILTKSTPEGARDYVVPSRLYQGNFYALPQSPQQYKQLLMVAGFERYFQIARCFRDEDPRGDRQPEFTQLDVEMSFVQREDVMAVIEPLCIDMVKTLYPEKTIQEIPFPRMSYQEAIGKYHSDKPDVREDKNDSNVLAFVWIVDFPFFKKVENKDASHPDLSADSAFVATLASPEPSAKRGSAKEAALAKVEASAQEWTFTHNPFSAPKLEHMDWLMHKQNIGDILTTQYDLVLNGCELGGGSIRNHTPEALQKVFEIMGYEQDRIMRNFGHMLEAFSYGAPPHGGIALGLDRLLMLLHHEQSIREVMAFPKTGDARDPMMNSPSDIMQEQWKELGIELKQLQESHLDIKSEKHPVHIDDSCLSNKSYHPVTQKIIDLLKSHNYWFETFEHEPVRTSEEAAKIRTGYTLHQGAKAMIIRVKKPKSDKKFVMLVFPGNLRFDDDKAKALFDAKDIRFATEEEVLNLTDGVQVGGVPPFGNLFGLEVIVDPRLFENEKIIFNAGDKRFSVAMRSTDYKTLVQPRVADIVA